MLVLSILKSPLVPELLVSKKTLLMLTNLPVLLQVVVAVVMFLIKMETLTAHQAAAVALMEIMALAAHPVVVVVAALMEIVAHPVVVAALAVTVATMTPIITLIDIMNFLRIVMKIPRGKSSFLQTIGQTLTETE